MALDKLVDSSQLNGALTSTANAIRAKTGGTDPLTWDMDDGFETAVGGILTPTDGSIPTKTSSNLTASGATVTAPAGYYAENATKTIANGTVVASVSSNTGGSASMAATGFTAASSSTSYYVTLSTSAGSVKAKAAGGTAGYVTSSTTNETVATSVAVSGNGNKLYIPTTGVTASVSSNTSGSASVAATGFTASSSATNYYVTLTTTAGSVKAKAVGNGTGIVTSSTTNETAATSVAVSGNNTKLYVPTAGVTASVSSNTSGSASIAATGFTASSSATSYYVTLSTTAGSVKAKAAGSGTGIVTTSTTNETAATSVAVNGNGTKLYIPAGSVTTSLADDGMSTYFNSGTSSDKDVTLTPKYTNTAGYKPAVTTATNNGGTAYYKIKTASPEFQGSTLSGNSTAVGENCTFTNTYNGIRVRTYYSVDTTAVTYKNATMGWVDIAAGTVAVPAKGKSSSLGNTYYLDSVTMTEDNTSFTVNAMSGTTSHAYKFTYANGRTSIKIDNTLTMQWNDSTQALDFIYT